jgi:antitoxin VapB
LTEFRRRDNHHLMTTKAKVFASGRSQAIRMPKEFRVAGTEVRLSRVPGGILISEGDPWDAFKESCRDLGEEFVDAVQKRERKAPQKRDFTAGLP